MTNVLHIAMFISCCNKSCNSCDEFMRITLMFAATNDNIEINCKDWKVVFLYICCLNLVTVTARSHRLFYNGSFNGSHKIYPGRSGSFIV